MSRPLALSAFWVPSCACMWCGLVFCWVRRIPQLLPHLPLCDFRFVLLQLLLHRPLPQGTLCSVLPQNLLLLLLLLPLRPLSWVCQLSECAGRFLHPRSMPLCFPMVPSLARTFFGISSRPQILSSCSRNIPRICAFVSLCLSSTCCRSAVLGLCAASRHSIRCGSQLTLHIWLDLLCLSCSAISGTFLPGPGMACLVRVPLLLNLLQRFPTSWLQISVLARLAFPAFRCFDGFDDSPDPYSGRSLPSHDSPYCFIFLHPRPVLRTIPSIRLGGNGGGLPQYLSGEGIR